MKNITFSADEHLIEAARRRASSENTTLNEQFRLWLESYAEQVEQSTEAMETIREAQRSVHSGGRKFTREEMNER